MAKTGEIANWFKDRGHMVRNNHASMYSVSGEPDLDIWLYFGDWQMVAVPIRIEVKRNKSDKPRKNQFLKMLNSERLGVSCYVVWDKSQCAPIVEYWEGFARAFLERAPSIHLPRTEHCQAKSLARIGGDSDQGDKKITRSGRQES